MLDRITADGGDVDKYVRMAKDPDDPFRLSGFGHRVYRITNPRARILKEACHRVLGDLGKMDQQLDLTLRLEEVALKDEYFVERKLYPNVDFYSGLIYRAMGFPTQMFPVLLAIGRLPGWIAHWVEMMESPATKIGRPRRGTPARPSARTFRSTTGADWTGSARRFWSCSRRSQWWRSRPRPPGRSSGRRP